MVFYGTIRQLPVNLHVKGVSCESFRWWFRTATTVLVVGFRGRTIQFLAHAIHKLFVLAGCDTGVTVVCAQKAKKHVDGAAHMRKGLHSRAVPLGQHRVVPVMTCKLLRNARLLQL